MLHFHPHPYADRHIGCCHILAIMNNDAMNVECRCSFKRMISCSFYLHTQQWDLWITFTSVFNFEDLYALFHNCWTGICKDFPFSTSMPITVTFCLCNNSNSDWSVVLSHCSFDFHFPGDYWYFPVRNIYFRPTVHFLTRLYTFPSLWLIWLFL